MTKINASMSTEVSVSTLNTVQEEIVNQEVQDEFAAFVSGFDTNEDDDGNMSASGVSIQSFETGLSPEVDFTAQGFSDTANALLNLEVTDEIDDLIYAYAKERGLTKEELVEPELFKVPEIGLTKGPDFEAQLKVSIDGLDRYFELSAKLDKLVESSGWLKLRRTRQLQWSYFAEEMDSAFLALDRLENKADIRLYELAQQGQEPSEEHFAQYLAKRSEVTARCVALQKRRYGKTRAIYEKAMALNADVRKFWQSSAGAEINSVRKERADLFKALCVVNEATGLSAWDCVSSYWALRYSDLPRYFTFGDTSSVDDPDVKALEAETINLYAESAEIEEKHLSSGDEIWVSWYANWLEYRIDKAMAESEYFTSGEYFANSLSAADEEYYASFADVA